MTAVVRSSSHRFDRSGYTLVELLIVVVLAMLLLGLMWGITTSVGLSQSRGRRWTDRAEFARCVASQFVADIAASIQDARSASGRSLPAGDDDVRRFGLVGTATSLRLDVLRSFPLVVDRVAIEEERLESMGADVAKTPKLPELKTVDYEFLPVKATQTSGLRRQEWDFHLSLRTGKPSETATFHEVIDAKFRYFDGAAWHEAWDSIASESLPTAVELTLRWRLPGESATTATLPLQRVVAYSPASPLQGHAEFERRQPPTEPKPLAALNLPTPFPVFTPEVFTPPQLTPPSSTPPPNYERTWMRGGSR